MSEASSHPISPSPNPNPQPLSPAKLLIRAPNWVGDAVMALPALCELRRIFGNSLITLAARPWVAGLFENEGLADNLVPVRDASGFFNRARHFISDARRLRRERFDYAVLLPNSFGSALAARAGGAKTVTGYAADGRQLLLDHVISFDHDYKKLHQVRYYLNIAAQIESKLTGESRVDFERCEPQLHVGDEQKDRARFMLERFGASTGAHQDAILAINPGATNSTAKRWPAERFAEIADRLNQSDGFQTVIVGAEGDTEVAERVAGLMRTSAVVLAGKTSIAELKAVLSCARLVISNDTGAAHVSAALGVPTVVVFGPTEHVSTQPLSRHAAVVRHDVECSPCMLRECPIDHRCMTRLEVEDVYRAACRLMTAAPF
jgi:heptosyltransferase-2